MEAFDVCLPRDTRPRSEPALCVRRFDVKNIRTNVGSGVIAKTLVWDPKKSWVRVGELSRFGFRYIGIWKHHLNVPLEFSFVRSILNRFVIAYAPGRGEWHPFNHFPFPSVPSSSLSSFSSSSRPSLPVTTTLSSIASSSSFSLLSLSVTPTNGCSLFDSSSSSSRPQQQSTSRLEQWLSSNTTTPQINREPVVHTVYAPSALIVAVAHHLTECDEKSKSVDQS